jgi:hypothetical protein
MEGDPKEFSDRWPNYRYTIGVAVLVSEKAFMALQMNAHVIMVMIHWPGSANTLTKGTIAKIFKMAIAKNSPSGSRGAPILFRATYRL